jgi:hypothetical protein
LSVQVEQEAQTNQLLEQMEVVRQVSGFLQKAVEVAQQHPIQLLGMQAQMVMVVEVLV